jgi:hypothetical protein
VTAKEQLKTKQNDAFTRIPLLGYSVQKSTPFIGDDDSVKSELSISEFRQDRKLLRGLVDENNWQFSGRE